MKNAFDIVRDFEAALCEYTGAPYAVAVNSCTNALFLALKYYSDHLYISSDCDGSIEIPKRTYVSVPMQIKLADFNVRFRDEIWEGDYELKPINVWDSARYFTRDMYSEKAYYQTYRQGRTDVRDLKVCVSFHWAKTLGIQQGGAILHADENFDKWARKARFDGRTEGVAPKDDKFDMIGYHMYMSPEIAAEGLVRLMHLPKNNLPLPNDDYPDLSQIELFK